MHPFSLNEEELNQVSGGRTSPSTKVGEDGGPYTTMAIGEEGGAPPLESAAKGGVYTTLAIGEEGGLPPVLS